jgi:hypothetical protein
MEVNVVARDSARHAATLKADDIRKSGRGVKENRTEEASVIRYS